MRRSKRLTAVFVSTVNEPGMYPDGDNLYLQVKEYKTKDGPAIAKTWIFRYMLSGVKRDMGLGSVKTFLLKEAREAARLARQQVHNKIDPIVARQELQNAARIATAKAKTFKECAKDYISAKRVGWRNAKHATQWENTLESYVYPVIGALPVEAIDTALVLKVLKPIWTTKPETANRVRGRIASVLDSATALNLRSGDNPARWHGLLAKLLPEKEKVRRVKHHPALPYIELPAFMEELRDMPSISARALEFTILTAVRTSESIGAKWPEIDFGEKVWNIPEDRMKSKRPHRVPLSERALQILKKLPREGDGTGFIFPGARKNSPLSNMAMLELVRGKRSEQPITVHGFRSTFRDWAAEQTNFSRDLAEAALAHVLKDKTEAAYQRGDLLEKRRRLMTAWAGYCAQKPNQGGEVVKMRGAR